MSAEQVAKIEAIAALTKKFADVLDFEDVGLSLNALADAAALLINEAGDPESVRNQFVAALDASLDIRCGLMYEPGESHAHMGDVDRGPCPYCNGSGSVEEETAVRTLADLEQEDFDMLEAAASR